VVLSLGTSNLIRDKRDFFQDFIGNYVTTVAMNQLEAFELTGCDKPLLAMNEILNWCDLVLLTVGKKGLYIAGYVEDSLKRETERPLMSEEVANFNQYEYSRPMRKKDCQNPLRIYTHINPYQGGPAIVKNTNGAGDAALAALLHDMSANHYHRELVANSPKHNAPYLSYSSLSQIAKYANRVSFEVLIQSSPRLIHSFGDKDPSLENAYWTL
jgi:inosine kinase